MDFDTLSHRDYLLLRAAAQKLQEKYECDLKQCPESIRSKSIENIMNLDLLISRCSRRECSFTTDDCRLLMAAVVNYRGILPQSSKNAHIAMPLLLEKLAAIIMTVSHDNKPSAYIKTIKESKAAPVQIAVTRT